MPKAEIVLKYCYTCLKFEWNLLTCGSCKYITYCSVDCQRKNWPQHRKECRKLRLYTQPDIFIKNRKDQFILTLAYLYAMKPSLFSNEIFKYCILYNQNGIQLIPSQYEGKNSTKEVLAVLLTLCDENFTPIICNGVVLIPKEVIEDETLKMYGSNWKIYINTINPESQKKRQKYWKRVSCDTAIKKVNQIGFHIFKTCP